MRYYSYARPERQSYPIVVLATAIQKDEIQSAYLTPFGVDPNEVLIVSLHTAGGKKKTPVGEMRAYILEEVFQVLLGLNTQYIVCTDAEYFKMLTGQAKADACVGYVLPFTEKLIDLGANGDQAIHDQISSMRIIYVPTHRQIFYDPGPVRAKIHNSVEAMIAHRQGTYRAPGSSIIQFARYIEDPAEIEAWLLDAINQTDPQYAELAMDIECFDLRHTRAGLGTIAFAWDEHSGIAFPIDMGPDPARVRAALKDFFLRYTGRRMFHKISFDVTVLIYQLFMKHILDTKGLLEGLAAIMRNWDCTRIVAYLATNSCAGNKLSLKQLAQEFAGNYAMDGIDDITKIPLPDLLEYNLVDSLSTWFVWKKYYPILIADEQLDVYENLFKPAMLDIIQMQLTGLPLNMQRVKEVRVILETDLDRILTAIRGSNIIAEFTVRMNEAWVKRRNEELKVKRVSLADANEVFNPNSNPQLQNLLYGMLDLPIISRTKNKEPSTDKDTLEALLNHTNDPEVKSLLNALIEYSGVIKILTSFLPAFENADQGPDGWHYLFGSFNLGGTISGRLSSSEPNLQNLPSSGSPYSKVIKSCFQAPPGWFFCGLDFSSLEDRISALTSKDPNKLKVYTDGYDGHCLRAYSYFQEQMPDIDPNSVVSINSIAKKYKDLRQDSKTPTFLLTYDGTYMGMMAQCGFSEAKAKAIEARYHQLYAASDEWKRQKMEEASLKGYVTVAFGLRVRTPLLKQVIRGLRKTPFEAEAEARSAGNALGQSWCLLNSRAGSEFLSKVRNSEFALDIRPCAQIHDASYYLVRDSVEALSFTNEHLVTAVEWQDHPDIAHDQVKLGGEFSIFFPTWADEIVVPNGTFGEELEAAVLSELEKREQEKAAKAAAKAAAQTA